MHRLLGGFDDASYQLAACVVEGCLVDMVESLFRSGRIADVVIAVMALEALVFAVAARTRSRTWSLSALLAGLLPGLFLVLALKAALVQAPSLWIAAALSAALVAHLVDVRLRLRSRQTG